MQFEYKTKRLLLRVLSPEHAQTVCTFYTRNKTFLEPFEPKRPENFYTPSFHETNLHCEYQAFLNLSYVRYWLFPLNNPKQIPIGSVCFSSIQRGAFQKCMLGYKLAEDACHQGYMQEALSFLIPVAMSELKLHRLEAYVQPENLPSIQLLNRLNFKEEGYLSSFAQIDGTWRDHLLFSRIFDTTSSP